VSFDSTHSSLHSHFAISFKTRTVGNTLSPMLHTPGTTVRVSGKSFNRLRSISPSSSFLLEPALSARHTVTNSFHRYWLYRSSPLSRARPIPHLQLPSTHLAGTPLRLLLMPHSRFLHSRTPLLRSEVVLQCLCVGCQRLGFWTNVFNAAQVYSGPLAPIVLL